MYRYALWTGLKRTKGSTKKSPLTLILVLLRWRFIIILIAVGAHIIRTIHMTRICIHNIALHSVFELGARDIKGYLKRTKSLLHNGCKWEHSPRYTEMSQWVFRHRIFVPVLNISDVPPCGIVGFSEVEILVRLIRYGSRKDMSGRRLGRRLESACLRPHSVQDYWCVKTWKLS